VQQAAHNNHPETYANLILDSVPETPLFEFVNRPDALDYLVSLNPKVQEFRPWFAELIRLIHLELTTPVTDDPIDDIDDISPTIQ
jgi:hypothetical protein